MAVKPPLVIVEDESITLFDSVTDAESDLESVDVTKGIYSGYDAEGHRLKIAVTDGNTLISVNENEMACPIELESVLRKNFCDIDQDVTGIASGDIQGLMKAAGVFRKVFPENGWEMIKDFMRDLFRDIFS